MEQLESILQRIKETRIQKNISLEDISLKTKINVKFLEQLEQCKFDFLPQPYIRAFIKSFARCVGFTKEEIEEHLIQIAASTQAAPPEEKEKLIKDKERDQPRIKKAVLKDEKPSVLKSSNFRLLLIVLPIIALLIYIGTRLNQQRDSFEAVNMQITEQEKADVSLTEEREVAQPQVLKLEAVANGMTWLRINVDGKEATEHNLKKGDQITWHAENTFQLRIGRAHAINLYLNEKDLEPLGPETSLVWEIVINKDGIASKELRTRTDLQEQPSEGADTTSDEL